MPGPLRFPRLPSLPKVSLPAIGLPKQVKEAVDGFVEAARARLQPHPPAAPAAGSPEAKAIDAALAWHYPNGADAGAVVRLLEGKSPSQLRSLREAYRAEFGAELDTAVRTRPRCWRRISTRIPR